MWLLVLLFIVLQPGLFITIPPVGKKLFASGKKSWASILVHALIFVVLARYVVVVSEGFQTGFNVNAWQCPAGSYYGFRINTDTIRCLWCPTNRYTSGPGTQYPWQCIECPGNQIRNVSGTGCSAPTNCQPGKYLSGGACLNCHAGQTSAGGTSTTCARCAAGATSISGGACTLCPANTFSATAGAASCTACPAGQTSAAGATSCTTSACPIFQC